MCRNRIKNVREWKILLEIGDDGEVPKWVTILFLILAIAFIAGVLYLCWRLSECPEDLTDLNGLNTDRYGQLF